MDYQKLYRKIVTRAQSRNVLDEITERHHIKPKALGGSDDESNIVGLTPREHFICHVLLSKIFGGKMTYALYIMSQRKHYTSRSYEHLKIEALKTLQAPERRQKISQALSGKRKTQEHIINWKASRQKGSGWNCSEERKNELRETMVGQGNPMFGRGHSEEAVRKIAEANRQRVNCPHCAKEGGIAIMKRWHFDNCKQKPL